LQGFTHTLPIQAATFFFFWTFLAQLVAHTKAQALKTIEELNGIAEKFTSHYSFERISRCGTKCILQGRRNKEHG
jgi:hypothetical protein